MDNILNCSVSLGKVPASTLSTPYQVLLTVNYLLGIFGNLLALSFLCPRKSKPYNAKHRLMLRCLACNDLTAGLGMMTLLYMKLYLPPEIHSTKWFCQIKIMWRIFGLGSGCVAIVMAVERCLALTKPFFYQKHVTVKHIKFCIFALWTSVVILVSLPLFGFGLYWTPCNECKRYKEAKLQRDIVYAYLYFTFGMLLTLSMVLANLSVVRTLCFKSDGYGRGGNPLVRRVSRNASLTYNAATKEELAFGKLMVLLSVMFILCWVPQLISVPLVQFWGKARFTSSIVQVGDLLLALHFTIDPYIYVLQRWPEIRKFFSKSKFWSHKSLKSSSASIKTTHAEIVSQPV
uniref:Prostacyclin receptor n=1 Tax=Cacopsylla melanoneura TaxID=428564 RepID=A0A8D9DZC6_9HEMI